jgi:hypothetical protein
VHDLTVGNVYLGKKLIQDKVSETSTDSTQLPDRGAAPAYIEDVPVFDDTDSVSSQDHSYLELIRDYTSTTTNKLFGFGKEVYKNSQSSVSNQGSTQGDKILDKYDFNIQGLKIEYENNVPASEFQEEDNSSSDLPETLQTLPQEPVNNAVTNPVPGVLSQEHRFLLSWKNLESLDTVDLVENSQKLLESVNKTLYNSETVASRLINVKVNSVAVKQDTAVETGRSKKNTHIISNNFLNNSDSNIVMEEGENAALKGSGINKTVEVKSVVQHKSEDVPAAPSTKRKERKLSTVRRRSVTSHAKTSLERHYSSDVSTC